jgi:hypothetical protein
MDSDRFDQLSRLLSRGVHRRAAVAALAALAVGGTEAAAAKSKHKRHGRAAGGTGSRGPDGNNDCVQFCTTVFPPGPQRGHCISEAARNSPAGLCALCQANPANLCGQTQSCCPTGQTCCTGACVDRQTDKNNCGGCGTKCPSGQTCQGGTCVSVCRANQETCASRTDTCCTTGYHCGDNFCGQSLACCGDLGARCDDHCQCCSGDIQDLVCNLQPGQSTTHTCVLEGGEG